MASFESICPCATVWLMGTTETPGAGGGMEGLQTEAVEAGTRGMKSQNISTTRIHSDGFPVLLVE